MRLLVRSLVLVRSVMLVRSVVMVRSLVGHNGTPYPAAGTLPHACIGKINTNQPLYFKAVLSTENHTITMHSTHLGVALNHSVLPL